jgi:hypothetical protein
LRLIFIPIRVVRSPKVDALDNRRWDVDGVQVRRSIPSLFLRNGKAISQPRQRVLLVKVLVFEIFKAYALEGYLSMDC